MKEGTFYARLYRRAFFFDTPSDNVVTCRISESLINVFISSDRIKVQLYDGITETDAAIFLGPNRHEFALDYIDGLKELLS